VKYIGTVLLALFLPAVLLGQAEHVPVSNYVYQYLDRMERLGIISAYSRAVLPLERKEVTTLIDNIYAKREELSSSDAAMAGRFYDEFVREARGEQSSSILLSGDESIGSALQSDNEKFLYKWESIDRGTRLFAELLVSAEYRALFSERTTNVSLGNVGGRFRGTIAGILGFGLTSTNGSSFGDKGFALRDRRLKQNPNFTDYSTDFFDFTEAYISGSWEWGSLSLGKEQTLFGTSPYNPTIVSDNAPTFDALKFNIAIGAFRFAFMHGFLLSTRSLTLDEQKPFFDAKYIAVHRAEVRLLDELRLGVFEAVVYSERELDPAYVNPFNFYKSAEHASGDRDNPMLGFDLQAHPLRGLEVFGSWTIDDVDFTQWGNDWWGNKFIWQGGIIASALIPNSDIGLEYTRVEPYIYTHFFENNTYTHDGYVIGAEIPPNSDQVYVSFTHWLSSRIHIGANYRFRRHGENVSDSEGNIIENNGADPAFTRVRERDSEYAAFLEGPRLEQHLAGLRVRYEPLRNYVLELHYLYLMEDRELNPETSNEHFLTFIMRLEL
jgi:capsule assembly protein Wzi